MEELIKRKEFPWIVGGVLLFFAILTVINSTKIGKLKKQFEEQKAVTCCQLVHETPKSVKDPGQDNATDGKGANEETVKESINQKKQENEKNI
jgi:hypothetical protein